MTWPWGHWLGRGAGLVLNKSLCINYIYQGIQKAYIFKTTKINLNCDLDLDLKVTEIGRAYTDYNFGPVTNYYPNIN